MFGQGLTQYAVHPQLFICASDVDINVDKETYQCSLGVFELTVVVDDAGKNTRKRHASCVRE